MDGWMDLPRPKEIASLISPLACPLYHSLTHPPGVLLKVQLIDHLRSPASQAGRSFWSFFTAAAATLARYVTRSRRVAHAQEAHWALSFSLKRAFASTAI